MKDYECKYCNKDPNNKICSNNGKSVERKGVNLTCTRPEGHKGSHVACGSVNHALDIWHYKEPDSEGIERDVYEEE